MAQISLIMPAYNASATIQRALDSVMVQTFTDYEVLVIDDGSSDSTIAIVKTYAEKDNRFRLIKMAENRGVSHARNKGLQEAKGKWIAFLDADDWMAGQRLERLCLAAETMGADIVFDNMRVMNPQTNEQIQITCFGDAGATSALSAQEFFERDTPYTDFAIGYASPLVRTSFVKEAGIHFNEAYTLGEDFSFMAEMALSGAKIYSLPFADYYYAFKPAAKGKQSAYHLQQDKYDQVIRACEELMEAYKGKASAPTLTAIQQRHKLYSCLRKVRHVRLNGWQSGWGRRVYDCLCTPYCLWFLIKMVSIRVINSLR